MTDCPSLKANQISPLHVAISFGLETISIKLLQLPLAPNPNFLALEGSVALYWATQKGLLKVVRYIIETHLESKLPKSFTNEMLELSTVYGRDDLIEYLWDFHIGMEFSPEAVLKAVLAEILNILQAYINTISDKMITGAAANLVFEIAAVWGKQESLRFALNHGVDPNAKNKEGRPVIIEALPNGKLKL